MSRASLSRMGPGWLRCAGLALLLAGLASAHPARTARAADPIVVEPADLAARADLVGREVTVDDRIRYFAETRRGQGYDQLLLRRTEVPFYLPARLRLARPPVEPNVVVRATVRLVNGRVAAEVTALDLQPADNDRLDRELGRLRPDDLAGRRGWALWAERRGRELAEPKLEARGLDLEAATLAAEADRPGADPVALADRAADRPISRAVRDALYHRGFRAELARTRAAGPLGDLATRIRTAIPRAGEPLSGAQVGSAVAPTDDPAAIYRKAPADEQALLDRRLYAAVVEPWLQARLAEDSTRATTLADEAARTLPDFPAVAAKLRQQGLAEAERGVAGMRQAEVEELAQTFRQQGQEDRARRLLAEWLADRRRTRLRDGDAEGRILLAASFEKLLDDRATAAELLNEAAAIDPGAQAITDAFLRLGYRKGDKGWYDPAATQPRRGGEPTAAPATEPADRDEGRDSLRGLSRAQVRSRMGGRPEQVVRSATQGMVVEQWIYRTGRSTQHILFRIDSATTDPRVTATYTIAR